MRLECPMNTIHLESQPISNDQFSQADSLICCYYSNNSSSYQVLRGQMNYWFLERVVPPQTSIKFEAPFEARIEVHTGVHITSILSDILTVNDLCEHL
jgi:hypothetical protein